MRELIHASTEILRDAWDPVYEPRELLSQAEEKIFGVHDRRSNDHITHIHDLLLEAFDRIDARAGGGGGDAIPTHFTDLDRLTGGLHPSEFIVLAARPSMGKTALATNIAENVAIQSGVPVLFVSLEMSRLELGPADTVLARQHRRQQVPQRIHLGRGAGEADRGIGQAVAGAAVHRRHAQPHGDRDRRLRPATEAKGEPRTGGDRLFAAHPARRPARPAAGAGGEDGAAPQGVGPRAARSR